LAASEGAQRLSRANVMAAIEPDAEAAQAALQDAADSDFRAGLAVHEAAAVVAVALAVVAAAARTPESATT